MTLETPGLFREQIVCGFSESAPWALLENENKYSCSPACHSHNQTRQYGHVGHQVRNHHYPTFSAAVSSDLFLNS